jgi:hypothetical protein
MPRIKQIKWRGDVVVSVCSEFGYTVTNWKDRLKEYVSSCRFLSCGIYRDNPNCSWRDQTKDIIEENRELKKINIVFKPDVVELWLERLKG